MIVTCPSCASKYRVRDEAVPPEGAELQCPTCQSVFVAHAPKVDPEAIAAAMEKANKARETAELRTADLERALASARAGSDELIKRSQDKDVDVARARDEAARAEARAQAAEASIRRLTDELSRARSMTAAGDQQELLAVKTQLFEAQKKQKALAAELDVANTLVSTLQADVTVLRSGNLGTVQSEASKKIAALQEELESLRAQQSMTEVSASANASIISAIGPMLWGLEQSINYLDQFAANEATLAAHVKQLRLLHKMLTKLSENN